MASRAEEDTVSMLSVAETTSERDEDSDSNTNSVMQQQSSKRPRHESSGPSRFKGVVPQTNGHWGAQIYANHQRVWLGTFKSEREAAMLYDSAAVKLRSGDPYRNFPLTPLTAHEPQFQNLYSTEDILNMIKEGSYFSKLTSFVKNLSRNGENRVDVGRAYPYGGGIFYHQLFQKELTPSDVGKLNRLVIPKKYAVKYFPKVSEDYSKDNGNENGIDDTQLDFFDNNMKSWQFRYCYWKSSQSYVFTRGWNSFVKAKKLNAKDVITFYKCECRSGLNERKAFWMIDVEYNGSSNNISNTTNSNNQANSDCVEQSSIHADQIVDLKLGMNVNSDKGKRKLEEEEDVKLTLARPFKQEKKSIRLFGVEMHYE